MVREKEFLCEAGTECLQDWLCLLYFFLVFSSLRLNSFLHVCSEPTQAVEASNGPALIWITFPSSTHTHFNCGYCTPFNCGYCTDSSTVSRHQPLFDGCQVLVLLAFSQGEGCLEQISSLLCFQQVVTPPFTQPSPALALHQYCHLLKALSFVSCCYTQMIFNLDPREALPLFFFLFACLKGLVRINYTFIHLF